MRINNYLKIIHAVKNSETPLSGFQISKIIAPKRGLPFGTLYLCLDRLVKRGILIRLPEFKYKYHRDLLN
jgi:hypothetical protein